MCSRIVLVRWFADLAIGCLPVGHPTAVSGPSAGLPSGDPTSPPVNPQPPTIPIGNGTATINAIGDTGWCGSTGMAQIGRLLGSLGGDVLMLGDLAYMTGSVDEFKRCFDPDFGRLGSRMKALPGNHDTASRTVRRYFTYFGDRAGQGRRGFYAFNAAAGKC